MENRGEQTVKRLPSPDDLRIFMAIAELASFSEAASSLGLSASGVSKRVRNLETVLGRKLFLRSAKYTGLTNDGKRLLNMVPAALGALELMADGLGDTESPPSGELRVCSSFGFGRNYVATPLGLLSSDFRNIKLRFELFDRLVDLEEEGFDLDIRVGDDIAGRHIATPLARNYRILCASRTYLEKHGTPKNIGQLTNHDCLLIRERDQALGTWRVSVDSVPTTIRLQSRLTSNNGEVIQQWARDGYGIILRSIWDVAPDLVEGRLIHLLPNVRQDANIWAVHPERLSSSPTTQACVTYLRKYYTAQAEKLSDELSRARLGVALSVC
jgi:LysR family transcriptional regulator, transcriptional activator for dmlA